MEQIFLDPNKPGEECITCEEHSGYPSYANCVSSDHEKKTFSRIGLQYPMDKKN